MTELPRTRRPMSYGEPSDLEPCEGWQASPSNPTSASTQRLCETVVLRCTTTEKELLKARAEASNTTTSELLRSALGLIKPSHKRKPRRPIPVFWCRSMPLAAISTRLPVPSTPPALLATCVSLRQQTCSPPLSASTESSPLSLPPTPTVMRGPLMLIKVFANGQGGGAAPVEYLIAREVLAYNDNRNLMRDSIGKPQTKIRDPLPEILSGNPDHTRMLIDSSPHKWSYRAGVISFDADDKPTEAEQREVMETFEAVAFAGLEPEQFNMLWVRHSDQGRDGHQPATGRL